MQIRKVKTEEEARAVYEMSRAYTDNHQTFREYLFKFRKNPDLFLVAYEGKKLIGEVFGFIRDNSFCELHSIAVSGEKSKKGIGRKLIRAFEKACKRYRRKIDVASGRNSEGFYLRVGYKPRGLLAIYENDRRVPSDLDVKPSETHMRRRDKTRFAFFKTRDMSPTQRADLERKFKADEVCLILEKEIV